MTRRQRRRLLISALIYLAVAAGLSALHVGTDIGDVTQSRFSDVFFFYPRAKSPEPSQYVVLVAIDDKSIVGLKRYGRFFGWPRTLYADVIHRLADARARTIVFNLCGHGHFDMQAYIDYFAGKLKDQSYDEGELAMALAGLPAVAA